MPKKQTAQEKAINEANRVHALIKKRDAANAKKQGNIRQEHKTVVPKIRDDLK